MKKLIIAVSAVLFLSVGVANAQTEKTNAKMQTEQVQKKKVEIPVEKLPEAVQKTLKSEKFAGWKVLKSYVVKSETKKAEYEVLLTNGKKKATYKIDSKGKVIR